MRVPRKLSALDRLERAGRPRLPVVATPLGGVEGVPGADGSKWYSGAGAPSSELGANGDFYLRTSNGAVYAKSGGSWSVVDNLTGPTGATGATGEKGAAGTDGEDGADGAGLPEGVVARRGVATVKFPGGNVRSNATEVTHGLGATPTAVVATATDDGRVVGVTAISSTKFTLRAQTAQGDLPASGSTVTIYWIAMT